MSITHAFVGPSGRSSKVVATTNAEAASGLLAGMGLPLQGLAGATLLVLADVGQTITVGIAGACYWYDDVDAIWVRVPSLDFTATITGVRGVAIPINTGVLPARGALAFLPTAGTVSAGAFTLQLLGTALHGSNQTTPV